MKYLTKLVLVFITSLILSACNHNPVVNDRVIIETTPVYITPPESLMVPVAYVPPPDSATFVVMSSKERESILINLYIDQNKQLAQCNANITGMKTWVTSQVKLQKEQAQKKKK